MEVARKVARKVLKGSIFSFLKILVGNVSGLFLTVFLARILGPYNFGIYSLALSIALLASSLSSLGLDNAVTRYTSYYVNDLKSLRSHLRYFIRIRLALSITIFFGFIFSSKFLTEFFGNEDLFIPFLVSTFVTLFYTLPIFLDSFFMGVHRFDLCFFRQCVADVKLYKFGKVTWGCKI